MKILIADSGSTKTDWALVDEQGNVMVTCKTQGISPIHQSDAEIWMYCVRNLFCQSSLRRFSFMAVE